MQGDASGASADVEGTASYLEDLAKTINEVGYSKQHVFSVMKQPSMMLSRTVIAGEEKSRPGFKGQADSIGANIAGDS